MSAIVAKAINDSLGTEDFKGLNAILDEQLDRFISAINQLPESIENSIKSLSVPYYAAASQSTNSDKLIVHRVDEEGLRYSLNQKIGKTIVFKGSGSVRLTTNSGAKFYLEKNGEKTLITPGSEGIEKVIYISPNDALSFYAAENNTGISITISMLLYEDSGIIIS